MASFIPLKSNYYFYFPVSLKKFLFDNDNFHLDFHFRKIKSTLSRLKIIYRS